MALNYKIIAQSADEIQDIRNSPAVSMGPYLVDSDQTKLLTVISIYSRRGETREQIRLLYMNATALKIWEEMGRQAKIIGELHRPPKASELLFGVPFNE